MDKDIGLAKAAIAQTRPSETFRFTGVFKCSTALLLAALGTPAFAQSVTIPSEYEKLISGSGTVAPLGAELFGDQLDLYTGRVEFVQSDVTLPGNDALPVAVGRRFKVHQAPTPVGHFGDWDLEIPHLHGIFPTKALWTVPVNAGQPLSTAYQRCSRFGAPPAVSGDAGGGTFAATEYWQGSSVYIPGAGSAEILTRSSGTPTPSDGGIYPLVTKSGIALRCLTSLAATSEGLGEGFEAVTPDGTRYRFDHLASRLAPALTKPGPGPLELRMGALVSQDYLLRRKEVWILPTTVTDRFGNTVTYQWSSSDPWRLERIVASDGRSIEFAYVSGTSYVSKATAGTRSWNYSYSVDNGRYRLSSVTQPDQSAWSFNLEPLRFANEYVMGGGCGDSGVSSFGPLTGSMTHPGGAIASFTVKPVKHGRSWVPLTCVGYTGESEGHSQYPAEFIAPSLTEKRVTGPGLAGGGLVWTYAYGPANNCYNPGGSWPAVGTRCTSSSPSTVLVTATDPSASTTRYTFGNRYMTNEGQLLTIEDGWNGSVALRTTSLGYASPGTGPFPNPVGRSAQMRGDGYLSTRHTPIHSKVVAQHAGQFSSIVNGFDVFARPLSRTESSSFGTSRNRATTYHDNTAKWILGQVATTTVGTTQVSRTDYNASSALPIRAYSFGKLVQTLGYNADGTVATVKDGRNNTTTLSSWYRGVPRTVAWPDAKTQSAVVNAAGWITRVTDENGYATTYTHDAMGRLGSIVYPTGDSTGWNTTNQTFTQVNSSEYGIPAGHWKQVVSTGNGRRVTYFDALWRPLLLREFDTNNSYSNRFTRFSYDHEGRRTFASYPVASATSINDITKGVRTTYDALGRERKRVQDSELGALTTTITYASNGGYRIETSPKGDVTRTSYQWFDQPTYEHPIKITQPEGVTTNISRDVFGKPVTITRGGGGVSAVRSYVYDAHQQLCKRVEPETGATIFSYDAAGNLAWSASGSTYTSTSSCNTGNVPVAQRTVRTYDARNRIRSLVFPDHRGDATYDYWPDGLLRSVTADNGGTNQVTTSYGYNRRRLLTSERMQWGSIDWSLGTGYTADGHVASNSYPGITISYSPNALGQATQLVGSTGGTYATGVKYHPNGAVKQFTYGNGITHTLTQNQRGLPDRSLDAYGSTKFLDDGYDYDHHGNVAAISDGLPGNHGDRTMAYDAIDRLRSVTSPMYGANGASYTYDALDNLTRVRAPGRDHFYCYDPSWRLTNIKTGSCSGSTVIGMGYDVRGNLVEKNADDFVFDYGNRLRSATIGSSASSYVYDGHGRRVRDVAGASKYSLYDQSGRLMHDNDHRKNRQHWYFYLAGDLIAVRERNKSTGASVTQYQHTDALGSPVAVTNDNRQMIGIRNEYEPYGRLIRGSVGDGPGYTGHVQDMATGLTYMQQRYYDPGIGRFLSADPVTTGSATGGNFNRYWYGNNNPYRFVDPDGRLALCGEFCADRQVGAGVRSVGPAGDVSESSGRSSIRINLSNPTMAISQAIRKYDIKIYGAIVDYAPHYGEHIDGQNPSPGGWIGIGPMAFETESRLAGVIGHEGRHELQFIQKRAHPGNLPENEAEAFRFNIVNANRFGNSPTEIAGYETQFHTYFDNLPPEIKSEIMNFDYSE